MVLRMSINCGLSKLEVSHLAHQLTFPLATQLWVWARCCRDGKVCKQMQTRGTPQKCRTMRRCGLSSPADAYEQLWVIPLLTPDSFNLYSCANRTSGLWYLIGEKPFWIFVRCQQALQCYFTFILLIHRYCSDFVTSASNHVI